MRLLEQLAAPAYEYLAPVQVVQLDEPAEE